MPILYEFYTKIQPNDIITVFFETRQSIEPQTVRKRLEQYNWTARGFKMLKINIQKNGGSVTLKALPTFIEPITMLAVATIVGSALGLVGTLAKMWVVAQITNPLLVAGPLGFPMVFWLLIAAGGVLIPVAIILKRR